MRQLLAAFLLFAVAAPAATEREIAEWALRWEGSLILEGSNETIRDLSQLPPGDFHIASVDLTAAVMRPVELRNLQGLTHSAPALSAGPKSGTRVQTKRTKPVCLRLSRR